MASAPQVVTLTAGADTVVLSTLTVARYVAALTRTTHEYSAYLPWLDASTLIELRNTLRDLCGADHLAAVVRDAAAPLTTQETTR